MKFYQIYQVNKKKTEFQSATIEYSSITYKFCLLYKSVTERETVYYFNNLKYELQKIFFIKNMLVCLKIVGRQELNNNMRYRRVLEQSCGEESIN